MPFLLLLEDDPADLRKASDIARRAGFNELEVHRLPTDAKHYLERAMNTQVPLPDAMLIDLAVGDESGFEILRYWNSNPRLKSVPVIIWTHANDTQREICRLFGVKHCVYKGDDPNVLAGALSSLISER
jgi:DNA-binding response OmpR family regulator